MVNLCLDRKEVCWDLNVNRSLCVSSLDFFGRRHLYHGGGILGKTLKMS